MPLLIINAADVRKLLPMKDCVRVMDQAMRAVSDHRVDMPERLVTALEDNSGYFFLMPGLPRDAPVFGAKLVSLLPGNPAVGRPNVQGFITLFDRASGTPVALVDGFEITRLRTAAASALATRELARKDASSHGIFGAGVLAAAHLEAIACVRDIREVRIWARDPEKARSFAAAQAENYDFSITAVEDPAQAARCDIVSTVTNSATPVLQGKWLAPGSHVNLVGAHRADHREIDSKGMVHAALFVDARESALREAGDLLIPVSEGKVGADHIQAEIGDVLNGCANGRSNSRQVTVYKSLGLVAQDLFAAGQVLSAARISGLGQLVDFP
ncbi:MAG: ornithine cyclodeaminase family protein [Xanthomonadales bacterium]|jgi:ornithine cyclodeaminase|nr:ornithine cyclodeaminase family protein [Xanthomonadales bacterium]